MKKSMLLGRLTDLYAPDIAGKDGKYYLYYDLSEWTEGVAVADSPAGPYRDGRQIGDIRGIDPCSPIELFEIDWFRFE